MKYPVVERFVSINGESTHAGELAVFIRFRKCNLRCTYCDTKWANDKSASAEMMTAEEIAEYVRSTGIRNVTLTGGEPLLQNELNILTEMLIRQGNRVEIETNGSISIKELSAQECRPVFTLDYKLPASSMENNMLMDNYEYLDSEDTVKFVAGSRYDLERTAEIIEKYNLSARCHVYISPVFGMIEPAEIVKFMAEKKLNGVRLQLQLHKFIWNPDKRGV
ncbi:MAG: putative 7-carboxy-7-deazaguanine synthase QueE [Ruminococcus sp.]|nr:putative 7-carboxy-7-deazaguanine synthase QueE [Ruminococcus sp.]MDE6784794.1 putative 7-carboxy-7-deazaguanine synthase QueE [Ruminococcus sp.]